MIWLPEIATGSTSLSNASIRRFSALTSARTFGQSSAICSMPNGPSCRRVMADDSAAGIDRKGVIAAGSAGSDRTGSGAGISRIDEAERTRSRSEVGRAGVAAGGSEWDCSTDRSAPTDFGAAPEPRQPLPRRGQLPEEAAGMASA